MALAKEGASIVVVGRSLEPLKSVAESLAEIGVAVRVVQGSVNDRSTADEAVNEAITALGGLDIVVNGAHSFTTATPLEDIPEEWFRINLDSGFFGTLHFMQAAFPHLRNAGGSIINFGSWNGLYSGPGYGAYAATKEAIRALSRVAARDWGKYKIRVNVINPASNSPATERFMARDPQNYQRVIDSIALGYLGDPEADIGPVAVFLASDASRYVSGQTLNAEGGRWMF
jgi:NAD(P)-dependent dehydrogenase (short-subunit alcohol dehydrogenase family)